MPSVGTNISRAELTGLATLANTKLAPVTPYDLSAGNLATELQRIRDDIKAAIAADFTAAEFRVSAPQVVGINPTFSPGENGRLYFGSASNPVPAANYLPLFRAVEFWYALRDGWTWGDDELSIDDDELSVDAAPPVIRHKLRFTDTDNNAVTGSGPYTIAFASVFVVPGGAADCTAPLVIEIPLYWAAGGSPVDPIKANFILTSDFIAPEWDIVPAGGGWKIVLQATETIPTGTTTFNHSYVSSGPWSFGDGSTAAVLTNCTLEIAATVDPPAVAVAIHPGYSCRKVTIADVDNGNAYTVNAARGIDYLELSDRLSVAGIWIARTLPTAAVNVFCDQDFAPYVQRNVNGAFAFYLHIEPPPVGIVFNLGVPTGSALKSRLVSDGQSPPAYYYTASSLKMLAPYHAPEDETVTLQSDNYPTFAAGATLALTIPFPYWLIAPWAQFPSDLSLVGNLLDVLTNGAAPCLTIYFSTRPNINPADAGTYAYSVNDTGGGGATAANISFATIATELGPLTRNVYVLIQNTSGSSIFMNVGQTLIPDEKTIREAIQSSLVTQWPVLRDTDDYPLFPDLDPFRKKWNAGLVLQTVAAGATYQSDATIGAADASTLIRLGQRNWRLTCSDAAGAVLPLRMFVSLAGYPNPADAGTYDFFIDGELTKAAFEEAYGAATAGQFYITVLNNTAGSVVLTVIGRSEYNSGSEAPGLKYQRTPAFFPTNFLSDNPDYLRSGVCESYSYNIISGGGSASNGKLVPRRGYAIYSIRVQRLPVAHGNETDPALMFGELPSTTGAITVKIGQWRGLKHTDVDVVDKGTFIELLELTIPDGAQDISAEVFWPVLGGAVLAWQGTTPVRVEALVNWQPLFHSYQYAMAPIQCVTTITPELPADAWWPDAGLRHANAFAVGDEGDVQFPPAAAVINDLNAALNLL